MSREQMREFRTALSGTDGISTQELAQKSQLYVNPGQLRVLAQNGFN